MLANINLSYSKFDPRNISGLVMWLDASDISTITKDGSNNVSAWKDKSGNTNDVSQGTGANQPTWTSSVQNGRDAILFTPANKEIMGTAGAVLNTDEYDIIIAARQITNFTSDIIGTGGVGGTSGELLFQTQTNTTKSRAHFWGSAANILDSTNATIYTWTIHENYQDATTINLRRSKAANGSAVLSGTKPGNTKLINVGGRENTYTGLFDGYIGEVIIYSAALSTANRTLIENYLTARWGL